MKTFQIQSEGNVLAECDLPDQDAANEWAEMWCAEFEGPEEEMPEIIEVVEVA